MKILSDDDFRKLVGLAKTGARSYMMDSREGALQMACDEMAAVNKIEERANAPYTCTCETCKQRGAL